MTSPSHGVGRKRVVLARIFLLSLKQGCDVDTDQLYVPVLSMTLDTSCGVLCLTVVQA